MKKTFSILITIMLFTILIPSCKKDSGSTTNANDLSGTIWVNKATVNNVVMVETISFSSATAVSDITTFNGVVNNTYSGSGTYIYTPPTVKFISSNGSSKTGSINGNNLYAPSYDGTATVTYVKQ